MWVDYKPVDVEVDDNTRIFHVFELRIEMNEFDHRSYFFFYRCDNLIIAVFFIAAIK